MSNISEELSDLSVEFEGDNPMSVIVQLFVWNISFLYIQYHHHEFLTAGVHIWWIYNSTSVSQQGIELVSHKISTLGGIFKSSKWVFTRIFKKMYPGKSTSINSKQLSDPYIYGVKTGLKIMKKLWPQLYWPLCILLFILIYFYQTSSPFCLDEMTVVNV